MTIKILPSGAKLEISLPSFTEAHNLQKAVAAELKGITLDPTMDLTSPDLLKTLFCTALSSDKILECIFACMKRCTYNDSKMSMDTFEEENARQDFNIACFEIAQEALGPFVKNLSVLLKTTHLKNPAST